MRVGSAHSFTQIHGDNGTHRVEDRLVVIGTHVGVVLYLERVGDETDEEDGGELHGGVGVEDEGEDHEEQLAEDDDDGPVEVLGLVLVRQFK